MKEELQKALEVLRSGGIILYPTDTVWGIGCDATDPKAVAAIYAGVGDILVMISKNSFLS